MCDCIDKIEAKLGEQFKDASINVSFGLTDAGLDAPKPSGMAFEYQEFKKDGTPKPHKTSRSLTPTFCPFCGVKYGSVTP